MVQRMAPELRNAGVTLAVIQLGFLVDHYVVVLEITDKAVIVADPLSGAFDFKTPPNDKPLILPYRKNCPYGTSFPDPRPAKSKP